MACFSFELLEAVVDIVVIFAPLRGERAVLWYHCHISFLQSSWSASRTLIFFFIYSKLLKKIMLTTQERRTDTPRPTSVRSQYMSISRSFYKCCNLPLYAPKLRNWIGGLLTTVLPPACSNPF